MVRMICPKRILDLLKGVEVYRGITPCYDFRYYLLVAFLFTEMTADCDQT
jgi:hypothetical protein